VLREFGKKPLTLIGIHWARCWCIGCFDGGKFRLFGVCAFGVCGLGVFNFGNHSKGLDKINIDDYYITTKPLFVLKS